MILKLESAIPKDIIFATNGIENPVLNTVHKYKRHPSIFTIKGKYKNLTFSFPSVSLTNLQTDLKI